MIGRVVDRLGARRGDRRSACRRWHRRRVPRRGAARAWPCSPIALVVLIAGQDRRSTSGSAHGSPTTCRTNAAAGSSALTETSWALGLLLGVSTMGLVTAASSWRVGYLVGRRRDGRDGRSSSSVASTRQPRAASAPHAAAHDRRPPDRRGAWLVLASGFAIDGRRANRVRHVRRLARGRVRLQRRPASLRSRSCFGLGELVATFSSARCTDGGARSAAVAIGCALMVPASGGVGRLRTTTSVLGLLPAGHRRAGLRVRDRQLRISLGADAGTRIAPAHGLGPADRRRARWARALMSIPATASTHEPRHRTGRAIDRAAIVGDRSPPSAIVRPGPPVGPVGSAAVAVGDRQAAVLAERLHADPHAWRALAALVLVDVDQPGDPPDDRLVVAELDDLRRGAIVLDVQLRIGSSTS